VSAARSDFGLYRPILRRLQDVPDVALRLMVTGAHLSPGAGLTVEEIEHEGFDVADRIDMLPASDAPEDIARAIGRGTVGFGDAFRASRPDLLVVLGDRFEMLAAVTAALPFNIPVAHIHGGELTEGAIDDAMRHAITKMSHVHFVSTTGHRRRVLQMGEAEARVFVTGAPGLDDICSTGILTVDELSQELAVDLRRPFLIVTYHPVTLEHEQTAQQIDEVVRAVSCVRMPAVVSYPNVDTGNRAILERLERFSRETADVRLIPNLGTRKYFSLLHHAAAMVGNSSSGLIEAPAFELPVVNVGNRQRGRERAANVIDAPCAADAIAAAIRTAISPAFRKSLKGLQNPYGDGHASERIVETLTRVPLESLAIKHFADR